MWAEFDSAVVAAQVINWSNVAQLTPGRAFLAYELGKELAPCCSVLAVMTAAATAKHSRSLRPNKTAKMVDCRSAESYFSGCSRQAPPDSTITASNQVY